MRRSSTRRAACPGSSSALLNRATQGLYPPGSTFKTVTAAAALDDGVYTPASPLLRPRLLHRVREEGLERAQPRPDAPRRTATSTFLQAYQHSINAVFCNIGKKLGAKRVLDKAKDFGFYSKPPIELPASEVAPSGLYNFSEGHRCTTTRLVDPGRLAFGQEHLLTTPLQMALVAAAVANNGTIMQPHLVKVVRAPSGKLVTRVHPQVWKHAMKPSTAAILNTMMQAVVTGGTGTAAAIPGIKVAGKTGTAETGESHVYDAWFIFFAPADDPQVAGAVVVEHQVNGFGGSVAAPIAKQLMQAILPAASKG